MLIGFDTPIQIFFHSRLIRKNLSVLSGDFCLSVSVRAVGMNAPCQRIGIRDRFSLFPVIAGILVNVVAHLIDAVADRMVVVFVCLPLIFGVRDSGCPCIFNGFVKGQRITCLCFPSRRLLFQGFKNRLFRCGTFFPLSDKLRKR